MKTLQKVLVFGGTHGNEWTGIYAVEKYGKTIAADFSDLEVEFILANPEAFLLNRRFKDEDLNRAFQFLHEDRTGSYEHNRAREIKNLIDEEHCFVLDLHTTTANMGNTVIISHDEPINFLIASELAEKLPDTRVIFSPDPHKKYLASQSPFGLMIEVGPVPNSVINGSALEDTLALIKEVLRSVSTLPNLTRRSIEIYEEIEDVSYPLDSQGEVSAYIHRGFQGKDFQPLKGKYTPFKGFLGEEIQMNSSEELYPIFINEAAYYPKKLAYTLCRKRELTF